MSPIIRRWGRPAAAVAGAVLAVSLLVAFGNSSGPPNPVRFVDATSVVPVSWPGGPAIDHQLPCGSQVKVQFIIPTVTVAPEKNAAPNKSAWVYALPYGSAAANTGFLGGFVQTRR